MEERKRNDIIYALPSFINQLLLLLSSGMVLQEAMIYIAASYKNMDEKHYNVFIISYIKIYDDFLKTGESILNGFYKFGKDSRVKDLSRVAGIIADSGKR